jgi:hypothetical protein
MRSNTPKTRPAERNRKKPKHERPKIQLIKCGDIISLKVMKRETKNPKFEKIVGQNYI